MLAFICSTSGSKIEMQNEELGLKRHDVFFTSDIGGAVLECYTAAGVEQK